MPRLERYRVRRRLIDCMTESYALTLVVQDADGDEATLDFTIVIAGMPSFGDQVVEDQLYEAGEAVSLRLPRATGGNVGVDLYLERG